MMFSKPVVSIIALAMALPGLGLNVPPSGSTDAIPAGALALQAWTLKTVPYIFPNRSHGWQEAFKDGTWDETVEFTWNNASTASGLPALYENLSTFNALCVNRTVYYRFDPTQVSAFSFDEKGHNGLVIITGKTSTKTRAGAVYTGGTLGAFGHIKWNDKLKKRTIVKWEEANTPPNYGNYPFQL